MSSPAPREAPSPDSARAAACGASSVIPPLDWSPGSGEPPRGGSGWGRRPRPDEDRTTRRGRDPDAVGWRLEGAGAPRRGACAPGRGGSGERLDWLAQNPRETHRVAPQVGTRCRDLSTPAVAQRRPRHDPPGKDVDRPSRQAWRTRPPQPAPRGSGVEERSITQGPPARRVGSDRDRGGPLWVGGPGRAEADLTRCVLDRGPTKTARSRVAGRDRGNAVRPAGQTQAPPAPSLFDTCQILRQLATALDQVRRAEDTRVVLQDRAFRNGQRATRLAPRATLPRAGRRSLQTRRRATQRLAPASRLTEEFGPRWAERRAGWARPFFTRRREPLPCHRLRPLETCATGIETHWPGIGPSCAPRHTVTRGCVEGLTPKSRVRHRRADGAREEEARRLTMRPACLPKPGAAFTHSNLR